VTPPVGTARGRKLARALAWAGLDADVLHTFIFRSWTIAAGGAMVVLVPACLSGVEQGYYYTFASLLALQIFFELGLNQVILQLASHEAAHAAHAAQERLAVLARLARRWYAVAAAGFFFAVSAGGAWFLARQPALAAVVWLGPWVALTLATTANLYLSATLAVLEGSGHIASVARLRFRQSVLGYGLMGIALAAGAGLWAVALLPLACAACSAQWLQAESRSLLPARAAAPSGGADLLSWKRDVFPLQWRVALSWVSGYFIFQLLTPLAFARQGVVEAGRLGITLAVFNAVLTAGMSWVSAKFPAMSIHLARHERRQANALWVAVATRAMAFTALVSAAVLLALAAFDAFAPALAARFAPVSVAGCIAVVTLANTFIFAAAAYLRAHKEEPMLWASLVSGLAILAGVSAGSAFGMLPMMAIYMAVTLLVTLPWTLALFRRYFRRTA
jgi:hypothetical protein